MTIPASYMFKTYFHDTWETAAAEALPVPHSPSHGGGLLQPLRHLAARVRLTHSQPNLTHAWQ